MLALKAHELGIEPHILSNSLEDPAAQVTQFHYTGSPNCSRQLTRFLKKVNYLTFENEFIDTEKLSKVLKKLQHKITVQPSLKNIRLLQDRWTQKKLLEKYKIKTAPFVQLSEKQTKRNMELLALLKKWDCVVVKTRRGGYDGYGTFLIKSNRDLDNLPSVPCIAEQYIPFKRELAIQACRNKKQQIVFLPLVETHQRDSRCFSVKGPVHQAQLDLLKKKLKFFLQKQNYIGMLGIEFFEFQNKLIVNELAPRVHNSAHHSLESLTQDQFSLHIKACTDQDIFTPELVRPNFAMLNLLGSSRRVLNQASRQDVHVHWYSKKTQRKGRKMGHITSLGKLSLQAWRKLLKINHEI